MFTITVIFFLVMMYGIVTMLMKKFTPEFKQANFYSMPAFIVGLVIFILSLLVVKVGGQEVGVKITPTGVSDASLYTGWHFLMPWEKLEFMDRTVWVYTMTKEKNEGTKSQDDAIWAPTKDGIKMGFDISISWKINPVEAPWIFQNVSEADGNENGRYKWIEENIIRAKTKSVFALTVSEYTPTEAYSDKRSEIQVKVFEKLRNELSAYKLSLEQVDIREVFYSPEYEKSINNKKLEEQEVLTLVEVTKQKEEKRKQAAIDKDIAIQKAMGESEALKIKGESISSNPKIIQLEWISKWKGDVPKVMSGGNQMMMLNLGDL